MYRGLLPVDFLCSTFAFSLHRSKYRLIIANTELWIPLIDGVVKANLQQPRLTTHRKTYFSSFLQVHRLFVPMNVTMTARYLLRLTYSRMCRRVHILYILFVMMVFSFYIHYLSNGRTTNQYKRDNGVIIVSVICGHHALEEGLLMMKSAVIFQNQSPLLFIVICELSLQRELDNKLKNMKTLSRDSFSYKIFDISYPDEKDSGGVDWKVADGGLPCTCQRLFLPSMLTDVSKIIYADADVLFTNDIADIWHQGFDFMNSTQLASMVYEAETVEETIYTREKKFLFYGEFGLNAGVMFMDLDKMRRTDWMDRLTSTYHESEHKINPANDQDVLNILFYHHPEFLYLLPCSLNFRTCHCQPKGIPCEHAKNNGISILHGWSRTFHYIITLEVVHEYFSSFDIDSNPYDNLVEPLKIALENYVEDDCGDISTPLLKNFIRLFGNRASVDN